MAVLDAPEKMEHMENQEARSPETGMPAMETAPVPSRKSLRPEWILGLIAGGAAILLALALILSRPYFPDK